MFRSTMDGVEAVDLPGLEIISKFVNAYHEVFI